MKHLKVPSWASIALASTAAVLAFLNQTVVDFGTPWATLATAGLTALAGLGIAPLTGPQLRNALHITYPAALAVSSALTTVAVALSTLAINHPVKGLLVAALTAVAGVLAGPAPEPVPPAAK